MTLSNNDHRLLLALWEDPLKSDSQLADELGVSSPTIKRRLVKLQQDGIIHAVSLTPNPSALGMELYSYLLEVPEIHLKKVEELLDVHPYTTFRERVFGAKNGIFSQFLIPNDAKDHLDELFSVIREGLHWIKDIQHWGGGMLNTTRTRTQLAKWNPNENLWDFSITDFFQELRNGKANSKVKMQQLSRKESSKILKQLTTFDLILLRELYLMGNTELDGRGPIIKKLKLENSIRFKQSDIRRLILGLPVYRDFLQDIPSKELSSKMKHWISERKKFLEDNIIREYRLFFDRSQIKLFSRLLLTVKAKDPAMVIKLNEFLQKGVFPYESVLIRSENSKNRFVWWLNATPHDVPKILSFLNQEGTEFQVMILDDDSSCGYPIWPGNFNEQEHSWIATKDYMVNAPLKELGITI